MGLQCYLCLAGPSIGHTRTDVPSVLWPQRIAQALGMPLRPAKAETEKELAVADGNARGCNPVVGQASQMTLVAHDAPSLAGT